jgi:hypothetical protein
MQPTRRKERLVYARVDMFIFKSAYSRALPKSPVSPRANGALIPNPILRDSYRHGVLKTKAVRFMLSSSIAIAAASRAAAVFGIV